MPAQYWPEYTNVVCVFSSQSHIPYLENISCCEPLVMHFKLVVFFFLVALENPCNNQGVCSLQFLYCGSCSGSLLKFL